MAVELMLFALFIVRKKLNIPSFINSNTPNLSPVLKMTFLNAAGCTWNNFSVCKRACGHFNFVKWENYGYLLWDYEACTWWILSRDFKTRQNPSSLSSPTFPPSITYQIWSLPWNLELESGFVLADVQSLKFSVKGRLFPHLPLSGCTRNQSNYFWSNFVWGSGREEVACIHCLVRAETYPCGFMDATTFPVETDCCIWKEKGTNQKTSTSTMHISPP